MRPRVVVLSGLPGSGKSTYLERLGATGISSDEIRRLLTDDPTDQTVQRRVFALLRYIVRQRLAIRRPVTYVDATNLTPSERLPYIKLANLFDADVEAVFFDVPLKVCQERNRLRRRAVPDAVIARMAARLRRPTIAEGFRRVVSER
ncbi:MAG: AAA family ATPase [Bryobacteraceae bacterium]